MKGRKRLENAERFRIICKELYEEAENEESLANYCLAISRAAGVHRLRCDFGISAGYYEEEVKLRRQLRMYFSKDDEYRVLLGFALYNYGVDLSKLWHYSEALDVLEEAYEIFKEMSQGEGKNYTAVMDSIEGRLIFIACVGAEISYLVSDRKLSQAERDRSAILYMREQRDLEKDKKLRLKYTLEIFQEIVKKNWRALHMRFKHMNRESESADVESKNVGR